jgi:hypothetical protein
MKLTDLDAFIAAYKGCALWSTLDWSDDGIDQYMEDVHMKWADSAEKEIKEDCTAFVEANIEMLDKWTPENAGHSFFLSRNGHGAGFFDYPDMHGNKLHKAAKVYGTSAPFLVDDGLTYLHH